MLYCYLSGVDYLLPVKVDTVSCVAIKQQSNRQVCCNAPMQPTAGRFSAGNTRTIYMIRSNGQGFHSRVTSKLLCEKDSHVIIGRSNIDLL